MISQHQLLFFGTAAVLLCLLPIVTGQEADRFYQKPMDSVASMKTAAATTTAFQEFFARGLGYCVGFGSLISYTPIAMRLFRQKHADGLVLSTWWLKTVSFLLGGIYFVRKGYDLSTYAEKLIIAIQSIVILGLVAHYQHHTQERSFWISLTVLWIWAVLWWTVVPEALVTTGQLVSAGVNAVSLLPQFWHNYATQSKGDYSPLTLGMAATGCGIRIFTTIALNGSDPILMLTFVIAFGMNGALLLQILYYGVVVEKLTLLQVVLSDVLVTARRNQNHKGHKEEDGDLVLPWIVTTKHDYRPKDDDSGKDASENGGNLDAEGDPLSSTLLRRPILQEDRTHHPPSG